ncbi:Metallo-beta-lactamase family protein [Methanosarcina siciliae C2J]|uniref:Metallo-beta-lactamase family protein n=1 Tax=Methanosarcina siciliae C2J TaxID=1434118 RepID=A0A0E3LE72_9EURY|nr:MBL fold metallo-hydrolase [Methanosarcina siciliae]AKB38516.1 Metallo-beta-lactamase family protein [Methanosarcina siciliae C2J]
MEQFSFIACMPDKPGALHRAAEIITRYEGNINRIQYDRRIDRNTVFFEVTAALQAYQKILGELERIGYLQTSLQPVAFLKFNVYLPNCSGALFDFLNHTSSSGANITFLDFDDRGQHPERLVVSLNNEDASLIDALLNRLKSKYRLEIVEYDTTGEKLDDTVFYLRLAQKLRNYVGNAEDAFLMKFLHDINHIAQELSNLRKDPVEVFENILKVGETLSRTSGEGFYADVQRVRIKDDIELFCFQLPCGGNIYLFDTPDERVMIDTGYGIYQPDVVNMLQHYGLGDLSLLKRIYITHADADHCGAAGYFSAPSYLNGETLKITRETSRAYGSSNQGCILEEVYTKMINLFSRFTPPSNVILFPEISVQAGEGEKRGAFPLIARFRIGNLEFEALQGLGGHMHGEIFYLCPEEGLVFPQDAVINFRSLSQERTEYNTLADYLMTSVNVDSTLAREERNTLMSLILELENELSKKSKKCLICCGHGSLSVLENGKLVEHPGSERYLARKSRKRKT